MTYFDIYGLDEKADSNKNTHLNKFKEYIHKHPFFTLLFVLVIVATIILIILEFGTDIKVFRDKKHHKDDKRTDFPPGTSPLGSVTDTGVGAGAGVGDNPRDGADDADAPADTNPPSNNFTNKSDFTNDLPYELENKSLNLSADLDYNDFLQKMSLDDDVIKQHNQYVNDRNKITSTASFSPSRSDNQDVVTTWGLTKPTYIAIDPSARNVPSQDPEQGSKPVRLQWK